MRAILSKGQVNFWWEHMRQGFLGVLGSLILLGATGVEAQEAQTFDGGYAKLVERVQPSVLTLKALDETGVELAVGSGFLLTDGRVVTNWHVVEGASTIALYNWRGTRVATANWAEVLDSANDVAVLPRLGIKGSGLRLDLRAAKVGERVLAFGAPEGLSGTVSDGIVSAWRRVKPDSDGEGYVVSPEEGVGSGTGMTVVQISAPMSHGSSGGPVTSAQGRVVGMSVAIYREGENLNFAIPAHTIDSVARGATGHLEFPGSAPLGDTTDAMVRRMRGAWGFVGVDSLGRHELRVVMRDTVVGRRMLVASTEYRSVGPTTSSWQKSFSLVDPRTLRSTLVQLDIGSRAGMDTIFSLAARVDYVGSMARTHILRSRGLSVADSNTVTGSAFDAMSWYTMLFGLGQRQGTLMRDVRVYTVAGSVMRGVVRRETDSFPDGTPVRAVGLWREDGVRKTLLFSPDGTVIAVRAFGHMLFPVKKDFMTNSFLGTVFDSVRSWL